MKVEIKDFLKELDLPEDLAEKSIDDVKTSFYEKFVSREIAPTDETIVNKVVGERLGRIETTLARELDMTSEEIKGKKVEELIKLGAKKYKDQITTLKEGTSPDVKEFEKQKLALEKDLNKYKELADGNAKKINEIEEKANTDIKSLKLGYAISSLKSKIPFSDTANDLSKKGFDLVVSEKYKFDFDEKEELVVTDIKGEKVKNEKNTGFLTPEEVLKLEAKNHNILKMSGPAAKTPSSIITGTPQVTMSGGVEKKLPKNANKYLG